MFKKLKWHRIGWTEGRVAVGDHTILTVRAILYVREPFLWFDTRRVMFIGDGLRIKNTGQTSPHYRKFRMDVDNWLLGGKIDYVSENGTPNPAKIIKLVKK